MLLVCNLCCNMKYLPELNGTNKCKKLSRVLGSGWKFGLHLAMAGTGHKTWKKITLYTVVMVFQSGTQHCQTQSNKTLFLPPFPFFLKP